jgi:putative glutathione S-transferase
VIELFATSTATKSAFAPALSARQRAHRGRRLFLHTPSLDPVYHFKCNLRRIRDYESLWGYVRDIYQLPGVRETCNLDHIKQHYFRSHERVNPTRIVPRGPIIDYDEPHGRARLG